jgi:hypothetical protein
MPAWSVVNPASLRPRLWRGQVHGIRDTRSRRNDTGELGRRFCDGTGAIGPLSQLPQLVPYRFIEHFTATVLWVRDPISRTLSNMIMQSSKAHQGDGAGDGDRYQPKPPRNTPRKAQWPLEAADPVVEAMTWAEPVGQQRLGLEATARSRARFELLLQLGHGNSSLAAYVDDVAVFDRLPPLFVGRSEALAEDFRRLQERFGPPGAGVIAPPRSHHAPRAGRAVPQKAVTRMREVYAKDYEVACYPAPAHLPRPTQ